LKPRLDSRELHTLTVSRRDEDRRTAKPDRGLVEGARRLRARAAVTIFWDHPKIRHAFHPVHFIGFHPDQGNFYDIPKSCRILPSHFPVWHEPRLPRLSWALEFDAEANHPEHLWGTRNNSRRRSRASNAVVIVPARGVSRMRGRCSVSFARPLAGGGMTTDLFQVERIRGMGNCPLLSVSPMRPPCRRNEMIGDRKPEMKFADRQDIDPDFSIARPGECRRTA